MKFDKPMKDFKPKCRIHGCTLRKGNPIYYCPKCREGNIYETKKKSRYSVSVIKTIRTALKDDAAGNSKCTMTDLDMACDMLDYLVKLLEEETNDTQRLDKADPRGAASLDAQRLC